MAETGRALVPFVPPRRGQAGWLRAVALVALFGLTAGIGAVATYAMRHALPRGGADPALQAALQVTREQVARLAAQVGQMRPAGDPAKTDDQARALRRAVDALRADVEQLRAAGTAAGAQTAARLDRLERDPAGKTADLSARLDRLERDARAPVAPDAARDKVARAATDKDPVGSIPPTVATEPAKAAPPAKLAAPAKPAEAAAVTPPATVSAKAPAPAKPVALVAAALPAVAPAVPVARPAPAALAVASGTTAVPGAAAPPLRGWVLRDVYEGLAVVEAQNGEVREIGPGEVLPGAGEVRSIERRGRSWVVLTSRGVIEAAAFERDWAPAGPGSQRRASSW